jgi:hypothetical protein
MVDVRVSDLLYIDDGCFRNEYFYVL